MSVRKNEILINIENARKKLLSMRFLKAKKKGFAPHEYKRTRKLLAKLLTEKNN